MKDVFSGLRGKTMPADFHWLNEPQEWAFTDEGFVVQAEAQTDYFKDPAGTAVKDSGHFLYTVQEGDFTFMTKVEVDMIDDYDAAVLMIMIDDDNWAKLCYEFAYKKPMIVSVVTKGLSDDCNSLAVPESGVYLRVTRFDNCIAMHYSYDAKWWEMVRYFTMDHDGPVKVGVVAQSPTGNGCQVTFKGLHFSKTPIRDIRSGK